MTNLEKKFESKKEGVFFFKSSNPYEFYHILNGIDLDPKQDIFGSLIFPEKYESPCPLVIPVHGSAGLREGHYAHMVNLLEGLSVLIPTCLLKLSTTNQALPDFIPRNSFILLPLL